MIWRSSVCRQIGLGLKSCGQVNYSFLTFKMAVIPISQVLKGLHEILEALYTYELIVFSIYYIVVIMLFLSLNSAFYMDKLLECLSRRMCICSQHLVHFSLSVLKSVSKKRCFQTYFYPVRTCNFVLCYQLHYIDTHRLLWLCVCIINKIYIIYKLNVSFILNI